MAEPSFGREAAKERAHLHSGRDDERREQHSRNCNGRDPDQVAAKRRKRVNHAPSIKSGGRKTISTSSESRRISGRPGHEGKRAASDQQGDCGWKPKPQGRVLEYEHRQSHGDDKLEQFKRDSRVLLD